MPKRRVRFVARLALRFAACLIFVAGPPIASGKDLLDISLTSELCDVASQQPNNYPMAGVDFVSEEEVLVYTVCRTSGTLSTRERYAQTDPNHLKAIIVDLKSGTVKDHFDTPVHGRESMFRVSHRGELILKVGTALEKLSPDGKMLYGGKLPTLRATDQVSTALSPAVDTIIVSVVSEDENHQLLNQIAVLDAGDLHVLGQWNQTDNWSAVASSPVSAVRSKLRGSDAQIQVNKLGKVGDGVEWKTVWSGRPLSSAPVFLNDLQFGFAERDAVHIYQASGEEQDVEYCPNSGHVTASRNGRLFAAVCTVDNQSGVFIPYLRVFQMWPRKLIGQFVIGGATMFHEGTFDVALSPSGDKAAVVNRLHLTVFWTFDLVKFPPS